MSHTKITEQVDIYALPSTSFKAQDSSEITVGDLHGNAMKLMFMLLKQGIATNLSKPNFDKLVAIYKKDVETLDKRDVEEFNRILNTIQFNQAKIRLIGDELADRGSNDYFTLKILQKLQHTGVSTEIIISNHSVEFLEACEKYEQTGHFHAPLLQGGHANSLENLHRLIEKGLVSAEEILEISQTAYKPNLKAISYSLNNDNSEITLYSHAGIGLNTIKDLAKQFAVPYKDSSALELAETIEAINKQFQTHVKNNTVHTLCPEEAMYQGYEGYADLTETPLVCAMWNRRYDLIERPARKHDYSLVYVHGHDASDPEQHKTHVHNLDENNNLGKLAHLNRGTYVVLSSQTRPKKTLIDEMDEEELEQPLVTDPDYNPAHTARLIQPTTITLQELRQTFETQLQEIKRKSELLRNDGHNQAADAAKRLYDTINESYSNTLPIDAEQFKRECKSAIDEARPQLESHRGWKLSLSYLALTATGLGALIVLADIGHKLVTGQHFSFFQTATAKKASALEKTVNELTESDSPKATY